MIKMDIESPTMKSLRKMIQKHKDKERADIDRKIIEYITKKDNK